VDDAGGARVLLLGAGGAARGVLGPLLAQAPAELVIANRTPARRARWPQQFAAAGPGARLRLRGAARALRPGDQRYQRQPAGDVPPLADEVLAPAACYDMAYASDPTAFLARAALAGASQLADGLGMLVEQAAEAFLLWRGIRPATARLIRDLRRGVLIRAAHGSDDSRALAGLLHEYRQCIGVEPGAPGAGVERLPPSSPGDFAAPGEIALLALCGEEAAGCVSVLALGEGACEMRQLWVRPAYRGGGTGRALASAAITAARAAGWRTMRFVLQAGQHEAATLLPTLDFRPRASYHEGALAPRLLWELELGVASMKEESR
jgi:GNAT superfamily N-acetyltransferase